MKAPFQRSYTKKSNSTKNIVPPLVCSLPLPRPIIALPKVQWLSWLAQEERDSLRPQPVLCIVNDMLLGL